MGSALILVYFYNLGATGYLGGLLLGEVVGLLLLGFLTRSIISLQVSKNSMATLLRYGLPLLPAALSMWALRLADRALIGAYTGLEQLAIYEIGYKMGLLVSLAIAPFSAAWPPFAFSVMRKPNAQNIYRDALTYLVILSLFVALGIMAFKTVILDLLAPTSYGPALKVVGWVIMAQVFAAGYLVLSIGPKISKRTGDLTIVAVIAAVVNLLLNLVWIPRMGIQGAAIATTIGYGLLAVGSYIIGQRSYSFPLDWRRLYKIGLAAGISYLLIIALEQLGISNWIDYIKMGLAWLSFPSLCLLFRVVTITQILTLWGSISESFLSRMSRDPSISVQASSNRP